MPKGQNATSTRSVSASEYVLDLLPVTRFGLISPRIARNVKFFETWCSYNGCEQVAFSDLSNGFKNDANIVFDLKGKLPESLVDKVQ